MSKIQTELCNATEIQQKRNEDREAFLKRLIVAVGELADPEWEKLSEAAQDWFNDAADAVNSKKSPADFPDAEEADEKPARGRRSTKAEEPEEKPKGKAKKEEEPEASPYKPKKGDEVNCTTKRGKEYTGTIVEIDKGDDLLVIQVGKEEVELTLSTTTVLPAASDEDDGDAEADEAAGDAEVGDTVQVTTKRGKVIMGIVVEIDDDTVVLKDTSGEEQDYDLERVELVVKSKGKAAPKGKAKKEEEPEEEPKKGRRSTSKDEDEKAAPKEEGKRTRASNEGVSVGTRIRELIVEDFDRSPDDIAKVLKKEGLEFRDNTVKLVHADSHKLIGMLKKAKLLK